MPKQSKLGGQFQKFIEPNNSYKVSPMSLLLQYNGETRKSR